MGWQNFEDMKNYIEMWIWDLFVNEVKTDELDYVEFSRLKNNR